MVKRRIAPLFLSILLVCGLIPLVGFPASSASATEGRTQPANIDAPHVEGEALVLLKAPEAESFSLLSDDLAGYTIEDAWDFSLPADRYEDSIAPLSSSATETATIALVRKDGTDTAAMIAELETLPQVVMAEPNYIRSVSSYDPATDPFYIPGQWSLGNGTTTHVGAEGANFEAAYDALEAAGKTASQAATDSPIIAVIDTGVDYTHPDLVNNMWVNPGTIGLEGTYGYDFTDNDPDPMPEGSAYVTSHGTHCAGSIAAQTSNDEGISGTSANQTRIMALRMGDDSGSTYDYAAIASFSYVLKAKVAGENVVATNCSWGGPSYSGIIDFAIDQLGRSGVLTFIAAGNDGTDISSIPSYPGDTTSPYAVVIAAGDPDGRLANFTCYSETVVDMSIGGSSILSTLANSVGEHYISSVGEPATPSTPSDRKAVNYGFVDFGTYATIGDATTDLSLTTGVMDGEGQPDPSGSVTLDLDGNGFRQGAGMKQLAVTLDTAPGSVAVVNAVIPNPFYGAASVPDDLHFGFMGKRENPASGVTSASYGLVLNGTEHATGALTSHQYVDATVKLSDPAALTTLPSLDVRLIFAPNGTGSGPVTLYLADIGLGTSTGYYGIMSGTSMATPTAAGCYGALYSLYGDMETPLELRGRLLGSTVELDADQVSKVASGGRFVFDEAVSPTPDLNPTTYTLTMNGPEATLYGRALTGATVSVDDTPVSPTIDPQGATATFDATAFADSAYHKVTVEKNGRAFQGRYFFAAAEEIPSLDRVGDVPFEVTSSLRPTQKLLTNGSSLYFIGENGNLLYEYAPAAATWSQITTANGLAAATMGDITYLMANNTIYACVESIGRTAVDNVFDVTMDIYSFDWNSSTWIHLTNLVDWENCRSYQGFQIGVYNGRIVFASQNLADANHGFGMVAYDPATGQSELFQGLAANETPQREMNAPIVQIGNACYMFGLGEGDTSTDSTIFALKFDGTTWTEHAESASIPNADKVSLLRYAPSADGNKVIFSGDWLTGYGSLFSYTPATDAWEALPYSNGGKAVLGTVVLDDSYYTILSDAPAGIGELSAGSAAPLAAASTTGLYRMDVPTNIHTVTVTSTQGGIATGGNWANSSQVLVGDTFAAAAMPEAGQKLLGWYAADGTLLSTDADWRFPVMGDTTVEARFGPVDPGVDPNTDPGKTGGLAKVGDPLTIFAIAAGALALALVGASRMIKRRDR